MDQNVLSLILNAGYVVKCVLLVLFLFSFISWSIMITKYRVFSKLQQESETFYQIFRSGKDSASIYRHGKFLTISPAANIFKALYTQGDIRDAETIKRIVKRHETKEKQKLERYLPFLATTGSSTPFIGLFGTVWGIMDSFHNIGTSGTASLAIVAPGIAEALIATAIGLVTAIPAVVGYNYFLNLAQKEIEEMYDFSEEIAAYFERVGNESK
ncbi:biopolymer transport membrane proton channel TolQ-like protein [Candidatus Magnetoovum chiemensis]|nr:biopolymer transport membrane proton channel TolQ-like protein [Candidatus Magnetoovum chiemensis]